MTLPHTITPAQRQVVDRLWAGKRVKAIARELGVRVNTVRSHIRDVARGLPNPQNLPAVRLIRTYDPANIARASEERD